MTHEATAVSEWQIASTIGTSFAVLIALIVYLTNMRHRAQDQRRKSLAQARLIVTGLVNPAVGPPADTNGGVLAVATAPFANHGDRPVLDVYLELWPPLDQWPPEASSEADVKPWESKLNVVKAGEEPLLTLPLPVNPQITGGWRIRWDGCGRS